MRTKLESAQKTSPHGDDPGAGATEDIREIVDELSDVEFAKILGPDGSQRQPTANAIDRVLGDTLGTLDESSSNPDLELALKKFAEMARGQLDGVQRQIARRSAIIFLEKELGVRGSSRMVDTALGDGKLETAQADTAQGTQILLEEVEPWPEPVDGLGLLDEIYTVILRHVALEEAKALAIALWVVHTHAHSLAAVSPILALMSPEKRCGKSTTLLVLNALVPKPLLAANVTSAALFRTIEKYHPTLLIDEADTFLRENDELRGILNSGHLRGSAQVVRTVGDGFEPRLFSTWAPKAIALIGTLADTLKDRSVVIPMRRRAPDETVEPVRADRIPAELAPLRRKVARWVADSADVLRNADPDVPPELDDRAADNWRPLLAIAGLAGWVFPSKARAAALALSGAEDDDDSAPAIQLLADIRELFEEEGNDWLASQAIEERLRSREDRPWPEWSKGKPITTRAIARLLKRFGIQPKQRWVENGTIRGYGRTEFEDTWRRYLPADVVEAVGGCETET